jgi:HD-GYP domain-containing protein (c-di-GMP phosphodiesterase class II)/HAMP domain-containing protein
MRARLGFLETAVARRMLAHFLTASALPALLVSISATWFVQHTLTLEAEDRVARSAKAASLVLMGRLASRAAELAPANGARDVSPDETDAGTARAPARSPATGEHATARAIGDAARAIGAQIQVVAPDAPAAARDANDATIRIIRLRPAPQAIPEDTAVVQLNNTFFWGPIEELLESEEAEYCVFVNTDWSRVRCSASLTPEGVAMLRGRAQAQSDGTVALLGDSLMSAQNDLFLRDAFRTDSWRLVVVEPTTELFAATRRFTVTLTILLALGLATAFLLAHRQIRVSTEPLRVLRDATRRFRAGDFDTPIAIESGDEFRELGVAFNRMTTALGGQLRVLRSMDEIDALALNERQADRIVAHAVRALAATGAWRTVAVGILTTESRDTLSVLTMVRGGTTTQRIRLSITAEERLALLRTAESPTRRRSAGTDISRVRVPIIHAGELLGLIYLETGVEDGARAVRGADAAAEADFDEARESALIDAHRLADRVALALGSVHLFDRLEALSAGTIRAFARTIDANSPWTAGHSERVTHLAIAIGRQLQLDEAQLGQLYRGGLLHDIGKVAVPPEVLDKPGRLTPEERVIVERHPGVGYDILSPIPGFTDVLPIVRSHHERIDGTGYPDRLAGDAIPYLARVLAVADVYDALTSDRPYRAGMSREKALGIMQEGAGTWLDAEVLAAFAAIDYDVQAFDIPTALATESSALQDPSAAVPV